MMEQETQLLRTKTRELQKYFEENNQLILKLGTFLEYHKTFKLHAMSCVHCGQFKQPNPSACLTGYTLGSAISKTMFELEEEYDKKGATENGALDNKTD